MLQIIQKDFGAGMISEEYWNSMDEAMKRRVTQSGWKTLKNVIIDKHNIAKRRGGIRTLLTFNEKSKPPRILADYIEPYSLQSPNSRRILLPILLEEKKNTFM